MACGLCVLIRPSYYMLNVPASYLYSHLCVGVSLAVFWWGGGGGLKVHYAALATAPQYFNRIYIVLLCVIFRFIPICDLLRHTVGI